MPWATAWANRNPWDHKVYLIANKDPEKVQWIRDNLTLPEIAEFWKDYLASSDATLYNIGAK